MKCPSCASEDIKVVDSRPVDENNSIRRRRECLACQTRFTTYEVIEAFQPVVVKKDGTKELFDKNKWLTGLLKACQKRPVNAEDIAAEIEAEIILKATMVDGVYDKDPNKYDDAVRYDQLSFQEVLEKDLKVMDSTAASLCRDNSIDIQVFAIAEEGNVMKAVSGEKIGTIIT